jgi:hypothetical protein
MSCWQARQHVVWHGGAVLVLVLVAAAPAVAQDGSDEVLIFPARVDKITIDADQPVVLHATWSACNKGMIRAFINGIDIQWILDGKVLFDSRKDSRPFWTKPFIRDTFPPDTETVCVNHLPSVPGPNRYLAGWATEFLYPLGQLNVGTHELSVEYVFVHGGVIDLGDNDGDGRPDHWDDSVGLWTTEITVVP